MVVRGHGPPAQLRGGDRQHPDPVPRSVSGPTPRRGRRAPARAPGTSASSHGPPFRMPGQGRRPHRRPPLLAAPVPGWAHAQSTLAHHDRLVEVAPAVGPVVGDLRRAHLDEALACGGLELGHGRKLARAVRRPRTRPSRRRRPPRRRRAQLDELGEHALGELGPAADGEADQARWRLALRRPRSRHRPPFPSRRRLLVERCLEALGGLPLLVVEVDWDHDVEDHVLVAPGGPAELREPQSSQRHRLAGLGAGGHLDLALTVERLNGARAPRASPASPAPRPARRGRGPPARTARPP